MKLLPLSLLSFSMLPSFTSGLICTSAQVDKYAVYPQNKAWSEDGTAIAWIETAYKQCNVSPCLSGNVCTEDKDKKYTVKTAAVSATNAVSNVKTIVSGVSGYVNKLFYMKAANYIILETLPDGDYTKSSSFVYVNLDDGRSRVIVNSFDFTKCGNGGDPFGCPYSYAYPSPSGKYYAVGAAPGNGVRSVVITIYEACSGTSLFSTTLASFKPSSTGMNLFSWSSENTIVVNESEIFNDSDLPSTPKNRIATVTLDYAAKKATVTMIVRASTSTVLCAGAVTSSSGISRDGTTLLTQLNVMPSGSSTYMRDDVVNLLPSQVYPSTWSFKFEKDKDTAPFQVMGCSVLATRTTNVVAPGIKCSCDPVSYTDTKSSCSSTTTCSAGSTLVTSTSCKRGWWDFWSGGKVLTCRTPASLKCKASTTGAFLQDETVDTGSLLEDEERDPLYVALDYVIPIGTAGVIAVIVSMVVLLRRRLRRSSGNAVEMTSV